MSRNEWEAGTITLPTAAVSGLRKALVEAANRHHDAVLAECLRLWNGPIAKTSSAKLFGQRLQQAAWANQRPSAATEAAQWVMYDLAAKPRTPRASDVERYAPKANSRTTSFPCGEAHVSIDGAKLSYSSGDNNHAVEHARAHPVIAAMFRYLGSVSWTRGSGGAFTGNDEYNREARDSGGGGNYITEAYGPAGEEERAWSMGMSPEQYRKLMGGRR